MVDRGIFDSGCSWHITDNKDQLEEFQEFNGGSVTFGGRKGYITGKGRIRIPNENQILLKVPRHHNMYSFDMKTPTPAKDFACLIAKATSDKSKMWHRRLRHINFKNLNKLMKGNLVRGLPSKGIKQEYSNARTPQQNGVAERMNRTLIEAARTMLADSLLPTTFWAEAVSTACYVLNRNQANPHAGTSEVTNSAGVLQKLPIANASEEKDEDAELIVMPSAVKNTAEKVEPRKSSTNSKKEEILSEPQQEKEASSTGTSKDNPKLLAFRRELEAISQNHLGRVPKNNSTSTPSVNSGSEPVNTGELDPNDSAMPKLEIFHMSETGIFDEASYDEESVIPDFNSLPTEIEVSPTPTFRIHNIHPKSQILSDPKSAVQTRSKVQQKLGAHALISYLQKQQRNNHKDQQHCLFAYFLPGGGLKKIFLMLYKVTVGIKANAREVRLKEEVVVKKIRKIGIPRVQAGRKGGDKKDIMLVQVYVDDIIFGSTKKSWCDEFEALMKSRFQMSSMGELTFFLGLQVKQNTEGIFISQDKYVAELLKKFNLVSVKTAITPMETKVALTKDKEAVDMDVHLYRFMIGSLMYLTASRPDIMFAVCACSRFQKNPHKVVVNSWTKTVLIGYAMKKHSGYFHTTEAEYVAAANCCGQVLWVQNQLLDYGFNFMNTKIHIDNESTICIVKNPVYHSKTKHIEIRHHFIRDCYEKKLISVEKIHTDLNVADLLTKPFDGPRFHYLVVSIGMINP
ncbi:putative ribonuclease H-like domain-containing protein [Tanacetum coccineum]